MKDRVFYEDYIEHEEYRIILTTYANKPKVVFPLSTEEFNEKKDLIIWLDFLIKTDQWITYEMLYEIFGIDTYEYRDLKYLKEMTIQRIETEIGINNINL